MPISEVLSGVVLSLSCLGPLAESTAPRDLPDPERMSLLASLMRSPLCYTRNLTQAQLDRLLEETQLLPPGMQGPIEERFFTDTVVWVGDGLQAAGGQAARAHLTYSFPADGTMWGLNLIVPNSPCTLNSQFIGMFGAGNLDHGRELVRQALASWRKYAGLSYDEVADNNSPQDEVTTRNPARGDIRIGGHDLGVIGILAYNAFPSDSFASLAGGDMCINTAYFDVELVLFADPFDNFRLFRNTCAHEHGHGTGNIHSTPCDQTKLMEPFISRGYSMLQVDERRGAGRNYGDRYSGNNSAATAKDFGNLTSPVLHSVIARDLSINGTLGPNNTDEDWFKFTLGSTQTVVITVTPTGGTYQNGQQISGCDPTGPIAIAASQAGNLDVRLRAADGGLTLQTANSGGLGATETLNAGAQAAGTYTVQVYDVGPNQALYQNVQLYDLVIRIGGASAAPLAIAGVNKRIAANTNCFFMGDVNSEPGESALFIQTFNWDLDGDGVFETSGQPQPVRQYVSNGVYPATLRIVDGNGKSSTDTINVTVFGATTSVVGVAPGSGVQGNSVPVTITGTNFKNLTTSSMVTVSGTGVTVSGTPVPNSEGTSVAGLSFVIAPGASPSLRNVTVMNSDGMATSSLFQVIAAPPPAPGPFDLASPLDGAVVPSASPTLMWSSSTGASNYMLRLDDNSDLGSPVYSQILGATSQVIPQGTLNYKIKYYWGVTASNLQGSTDSTPATRWFRTPPCPGDANYDKLVSFPDITMILNRWGITYPAGESGPGDANNDDFVSFPDVTSTLQKWSTTCP